MGNVSPITTLRNKKIWITSPDNTNVVEAAHALSNHRGKNLKLLTIVIDTNVEEDCCEDDNYEEDNHNKESELALRFKELEYWEND
ncbi:hypothetical protein RhiirA4_543908 [Rhizophagus irregularis]|uniref:Uncharacterized protein n=1 Tax=Rhizophagus irregularis TaxID=588596 RepID=A0A2I1GL62_9GLOM|nr:hypothetical protein RhiirA4_543908 [Rhizophagus irregularis]